VEFIPDQVDDGVLYISKKYDIIVHKCCCGCGEEVVTPLTPVDWQIYHNGNSVTLSPSVGNWNFSCRSHYWIRRNQIIWATSLTQEQVHHVQERDRVDKERYIVQLNARGCVKKRSTLHGVWLWLRKWWKQFFKL